MDHSHVLLQSVGVIRLVHCKKKPVKCTWARKQNAQNKNGRISNDNHFTPLCFSNYKSWAQILPSCLHIHLFTF